MTDNLFDLLRIGERAGFFLDSATFLHNLGIVHEKLGELDLAEEHYQRALNVYTEMGYQPGRVRSTNCLGIVRRRRRDYATALSLSREALTEMTENFGETLPKTVRVKTMTLNSRGTKALDAARGTWAPHPEWQRQWQLPRRGSPLYAACVQKTSQQSPALLEYG